MLEFFFPRFNFLIFNPAGTCKTMKWGVCEGPPCACTLLVGNAVKQTVDCEQREFFIII